MELTSVGGLSWGLGAEQSGAPIGLRGLLGLIQEVGQIWVDQTGTSGLAFYSDLRQVLSNAIIGSCRIPSEAGVTIVQTSERADALWLQPVWRIEKVKKTRRNLHNLSVTNRELKKLLRIKSNLDINADIERIFLKIC
jgi:hypothetical protein